MVVHRVYALTLLLLSWFITGCPNRSPTVSVQAVITDAGTDVVNLAQRPRNRGRGRNRGRNNGNPTNNARTTDNTNDEALPRGPMLPDELGPAPEQQLNLASGNSAPARHLSSEQISTAMQPLLGRLLACAQNTSDTQGNHPRGRVGIRLRIHNDGHPMAASVQNPTQATGFTDCIRRVVATARFDAFDGPDIFVNWGFTIED